MPAECTNTMSFIAIHAVFYVGSLHAAATFKHRVPVRRDTSCWALRRCTHPDIAPKRVMYNAVPHSDVHQNASPGCLTTELCGCTPIQTPRELYLNMHMVYICCHAQLKCFFGVRHGVVPIFVVRQSAHINTATIFHTPVQARKALNDHVCVYCVCICCDQKH